MPYTDLSGHILSDDEYQNLSKGKESWFHFYRKDEDVDGKPGQFVFIEAKDEGKPVMRVRTKLKGRYDGGQ